MSKCYYFFELDLEIERTFCRRHRELTAQTDLEEVAFIEGHPIDPTDMDPPNLPWYE